MEGKKTVSENFKKVLDQINSVKAEKNITKNIIFLAVSKRRPAEHIQEVYNLGHRIFGENYVAELLEKCDKLPKDIEWHLIGHLQTNKIKKLLEKIPNIIIESVDSVKVAEELNKQCQKDGIQGLKVYMEINISNSTTKTSADMNTINDIADTIITKCPNLKLVGIMSLGNVNNLEEFREMIKIKTSICEKYSLDPNTFIASFGTSQDFENAIREGSDEVRVGHQIFDIA
ncbi:MAG: YggS family pyridoxal phosphate-dependent enzyme [archaeon]|nr:YggS family pyridoxal phosphate-dependent enzyme [archaeon]